MPEFDMPKVEIERTYFFSNKKLMTQDDMSMFAIMEFDSAYVDEESIVMQKMNKADSETLDKSYGMVKYKYIKKAGLDVKFEVEPADEDEILMVPTVSLLNIGEDTMVLCIFGYINKHHN